MKKKTSNLWFFKPNVDFHRLLRNVKIAILLVVCALGLLCLVTRFRKSFCF